MLEVEEIKKRMETHNMKLVAEKIGIAYWKLRHALRSDDPKYWPLRKCSDFLEGKGE